MEKRVRDCIDTDFLLARVQEMIAAAPQGLVVTRLETHEWKSLNQFCETIELKSPSGLVMRFYFEHPLREKPKSEFEEHA